MPSTIAIVINQRLLLKSRMSEDIYVRLAKSSFRSRFHLSKKDQDYIRDKGLDVIRRHAKEFVQKRLSPPVSQLKNDGKQTPMRGHPVFVAQHACACCCRQCLFKWHGIDTNHWLTDSEQLYIVEFLRNWIKKEMI